MFVEMPLERAVKRALDRFANAAREMDIRGVNNDLIRTLFDIDDAVERMLRFLGRILVAREIYHICLLLGRQRAAQGDDPGRVSVVDPDACPCENSFVQKVVGGKRQTAPLLRSSRAGARS
jgi:hypothetical protein